MMGNHLKRNLDLQSYSNDTHRRLVYILIIICDQEEENTESCSFFTHRQKNITTWWPNRLTAALPQFPNESLDRVRGTVENLHKEFTSVFTSLTVMSETGAAA